VLLAVILVAQYSVWVKSIYKMVANIQLFSYINFIFSSFHCWVIATHLMTVIHIYAHSQPLSSSRGSWCCAAGKITVGVAKSNDRLLPGLFKSHLQVNCLLLRTGISSETLWVLSIVLTILNSIEYWLLNCLQLYVSNQACCVEGTVKNVVLHWSVGRMFISLS